MVKGIFLYYPEAAYLEETRVTLRNSNILDVEQEIEANPRIVSNLVPGTLQRGAKSWLIFFQSNSPQELLILPFPDENLPQRSGKGYLADLIPILNQCFVSRPPHIPPEWIGRFQYLRVEISLYSLIDRDLGLQQGSQESQQSVRLFQETSQDIRRRREHKLNEAQRRKDFNVLEALDGVFAKANDRLFEKIRHRGFQEVVPSIIYDFLDVMDGETMRFLISSETVGKFADENSLSSFDYSAPGCGLWKAVERELNLSLVLHLRRGANIVESVCIPWKKGGSASTEFPILIRANQSIDLSECESKRSKNLKGIMLGDMINMLKLGHCNTVREKLENLGVLSADEIQHLLDQHSSGVTFPQYLDEIRKLRNGHAHISAMSQQEFKRLRNLVLPNPKKKATACLVEILELKKKILKYWEDKGDCFTQSQMNLTTGNGQTVDFRGCNRMIVFPTKDGTTGLFAKDTDTTYCCIAIFDKVEKASAALASLAQAAGAGESWDAREFKKQLDN